MDFEKAGCIAIELECVPARVAAEITQRTKMLVFSMGSGPDCDGQYIFAEDLLGTNGGHYPRHSITYTNLYDRAVEGLAKYRSEVLSGAYPTPNHTIKMKTTELAAFREFANKQQPKNKPSVPPSMQIANSAGEIPRKKKLTVAELQALKGQRKLVLCTAFDEWTARAAEAAGVDMLVSWGDSMESTKYIVKQVRKGAPNTLIGSGINPGAYESAEKALRLAEELRAVGTDIIYCSGLVPEKFGALSHQHYPCCGHVGYLPVNDTWFGGPRAVGKTAVEAEKLFNDVMELEAAGCIAIELECVPAKVAAELTRSTKMLVFSMGSGPDCDGQFIFAEDLLGTNGGHYPRHSITYTNLFDQAVEALKKYRSEVLSLAYPKPNHTIKMKREELAVFRNKVSKPLPCRREKYKKGSGFNLTSFVAFAIGAVAAGIFISRRQL